MTGKAQDSRRRAVRRLFLRAVVLFSALLLVNALVVGWLFFHDFGQRAIRSKLVEAHDIGRAIASQLAREIAPSGSIDLARLEDRRERLTSLIGETTSQFRFVSSLQVRDGDGRLLLEMRRGTGGEPEIRLAGRSFGGAAPLSPDSPPVSTLSTLDESADAAGRAAARVVELPLSESGDSRLYLATLPGAIESEVESLRRELLGRLAFVGLISLVLLGIAFFYVLRLLNRTRRVEAESQRAEQLAYLGTLASGLAHEIRNPLNAMNINLQMLEEEARSGEIGEDTLALLRSSRDEVLRLERLVKDFLAYARPRSSRRAELDPASLVGDVVRFVRPQFEDAGVALTLDRERGAPSVHVDQERIRQALLNILRNALEVSEPGSTVRVRVGATEGGEALIEIVDEGPGIPGELRSQIFEVFWSKKVGGSGLGLPIALRAVEGHGGRIDLHSRVGEGSCFRIVLPPALAVQATVEPALTETSERGGR